jgi:phosphoenolpyruvate synthase/pyruvate phosphate dikinase
VFHLFRQHRRFDGQHDSFLNIRDEQDLLKAVHACFVSLYNDRAIKYREDQHIDHLEVGMSVGVQRMVRADKACSGVAFTLEPESGFRDLIHIAGCWGLGENIVQGLVNPDEYFVFKTTFLQKKNAIIQRKLGSKLKTMVYADALASPSNKAVVNTDTPIGKQASFVLTDEEVNRLEIERMINNLREIEKKIIIKTGIHVQGPTADHYGGYRISNPIAAAFAHRLAIFVKNQAPPPEKKLDSGLENDKRVSRLMVEGSGTN